MQTVRHGSGSGLTDDAHDLQPGQLACPLRRIALGSVEIGRDRKHGFVDFHAESLFCDGLEAFQHDAAYLLRSNQSR